MTQREFFVAITNGTMNDEIKDFAKERIIALDNRNKSRANSPKAEAEAAKRERFDADVISSMTANEVYTAADIAQTLGKTTSAVSASFKRIKNSGCYNLTITDVISNGRVVKGYSIAE